MTRVLVTGGNGFLGRFVCRALVEAGHEVRATVRDPATLDRSRPELKSGCSWIVTRDLAGDFDAQEALAGIQVVVHLAARAHVLHETAPDPLAEFQRVNTTATRNLADLAARARVQRFIFISTVGVNGNQTRKQHPFTETDVPMPHSPYAVSKLLAEEALREKARAAGMEFVILRPPLAYGPGVKGNFLNLIRLIDRGFPLPLASLTNRRSLVSAANLADLIVRCIDHENAADKTFMISDCADLSTADLIKKIAASLGRPARLIPFPPGLLILAAKCAGRYGSLQGLFESLQVDCSHTRSQLCWSPPQSLEEGLAETAHWYRSL